MAINETIVTGRKFRKCIDAVNKTWQRISFWTKSSDVEFADGKNAETKLGAIDGITDSLVNTSSRIAASAKAVSTLNNNLSNCKVMTEGSGANTKYYIQIGADTASKKLLGSANVSLLDTFFHTGGVITYTFTKAVQHGVIVSSGNGSVGSNFGFIIGHTGSIHITTLAEKTSNAAHCISAYDFVNASIGDTIKFQLSAGGGGAIIALNTY